MKHKWKQNSKQTNQNYTTCNEIILKTIQPLIYEINLSIQIQEEEPLLLGLDPSPRDSTL